MGDDKITLVIHPKHTEIFSPPLNAVIGEVHAAQWGLYTKLMKESGFDKWDINHTKKWSTRYLKYAWLMMFDIANDGMVPIATCAAMPGTPDGKHLHGAATIQGLAVSPEYRKRGIATWLLSATVSRLSRKGYSSIWVSVHSDRPDALRAYEKAGFKNASN